LTTTFAGRVPDAEPLTGKLRGGGDGSGTNTRGAALLAAGGALLAVGCALRTAAVAGPAKHQP